MKRGTHTIRSGFTPNSGGSNPRRYSLDNGNYDVNMKITDLEIFPISTDPANRDSLASAPVFFCIATSAEGATPFASSASLDEYDPVLNLRPSDSRQIAWGIISPAYGYVYATVDPDHIIPEDLYVNAWSISSGGSLTTPYTSCGFVIRMQQIKSSGTEGLLYQAKTNLLE
jgi:hypothetical protein